MNWKKGIEMSIPDLLVEDNFLDIFDHLIKDERIEINDSKINLFCLKINSKNFNYELLENSLLDTLVSYCIPRRQYDELYANKKIGQMNRQAKKLFRDHESNDGELGELILYSFLESHLKAPKILSKMKLKTSSNEYVKRADGIHILRLDNANYELIFGESKLYDNLTDGLREAFYSIKELKTRKENNMYDEIDLITTHIPAEFIQENYEFIKKIIVPQREESIDYDVSFGVFIGFEIAITDDMKKLSNKDIRDSIRKDIMEQSIKKIKYINEKISELELDEHNFYIYLMPFTEIDKKRKELIQSLTS